MQDDGHHTATIVAVDQSVQQRASGNKKTNHIYLKVAVLEGQDFSGHLADVKASDLLHTFSLHLQFRHQRATSASPAAASVTPAFSETFVFLLNEHMPSSAAEWTALLELNEPLHLVLTRQRAVQPQHDAPKRELVGSCSIDWRKALICDDPVPLKLQSQGHDSVLLTTEGVLLCRLDVVASPADAAVPFAAEAVSRIMALQSARSTELQRSFYLYTKQWWAEFVELGAAQRGRRVKLFAQDELGKHRSVCSFLPLQVVGALTGRLAGSPLQAARLVSLIPYDRQVTVGGTRVDTWHSFHAFLVRGRGDCEDHALLLATLLTAFGLDAYVCIGEVDDEDGAAGSRKDHVWCATFTGEPSQQRITFWESLTGQCYDVSPAHAHSSSSSSRKKQQQQQQQPAVLARKQHHFHSIACMFSARALYANKQPDHRLSHTLLDISDARLWKSLDAGRIAALPHDHTDLALLRSPLDPITAAAQLEGELRQRFAAQREEAGLNTLWDERLSLTLQAALSAYETERVTGVAAGGQEFQAAVRRAVPDKHCFKGYPTCYAHVQPQRMYSSLSSSPVGSDIVATVGDHTRFALRVQVHAYAECAVAVWVMLAVRFQPCEVL